MMQGTEGKSEVEIIEEKQDNDFISTMPSEILANIVSRLEFKEAGRTSVLATRWRYIWTLFYGILTLDKSVKLFMIRRQHMPPFKKYNKFVSEWEKFMSNVEYIITSLESLTLEGLRICFDMGNPAKLVKLFEFACWAKVQVLDLDCSFHFTEPFFAISQTIRNVLPSGFASNTLRELRLVCVDVTGKVIEQFLAQCPSLETLYVKDSIPLRELIVSGEGLKLKRLELLECNIASLFIYAENLEVFTYRGELGRFTFPCVPKLVEAKFGGRYCLYIQSRMNEDGVNKLLSDLTTLKLELFHFPLPLVYARGLPVFNNVKHLELMIHQRHDPDSQLNYSVSLLASFPSITVLKLKFFRYKLMRPEEEEWNANLETELPNLQELQMSGCRNDPNQNELIRSVINKAPNLRRIVLDPVSSVYDDRSDELKAMINSLRRDFNLFFADKLKSSLLPPHVEVLVL